MHEIELLVYRGNEPAVALCRKLGFAEEEPLKDRIWLLGGGYIGGTR